MAADSGTRSQRHVLTRPTSKTSVHRRGFPFEWDCTRHLHVWIGLGDVALQVQARVYRFELGFTFWRSYGDR